MTAFAECMVARTLAHAAVPDWSWLSYLRLPRIRVPIGVLGVRSIRIEVVPIGGADWFGKVSGKQGFLFMLLQPQLTALQMHPFGTVEPHTPSLAMVARLRIAGHHMLFT